MVVNYSSQSSETLHHKSTLRQLIGVFFIIIATIGNSLVLLSVYRFRSMRTIPNMIIFNLSLTDLLFSLTFLPVSTFIWSRNDFIISSSLCSVIALEALLLSLVSIYSLVFISGERFLATNYPLKHRSVFTRKAIKIGLLVIWIWSTALSGISFIMERYVYIEKFYHCMLDWENSKEVALVIVGLAFSLPLLTLLFCNVFILKAVWRSRKFTSEHASASSGNSAGFCREHGTSFLTMTVVMAFVLFWTPYTIGNFSLASGAFSLPEEFMSTAVIFAGANSVVNPVIYGVMNKNFRSAFKKILCRRK